MDEFIYFCVNRSFWEYYILIVFYERCVRVRSQYVSFGRVGEVS